MRRASRLHSVVAENKSCEKCKRINRISVAQNLSQLRERKIKKEIKHLIPNVENFLIIFETEKCIKCIK